MTPQRQLISRKSCRLSCSIIKSLLALRTSVDAVCVFVPALAHAPHCYCCSTLTKTEALRNATSVYIPNVHHIGRSYLGKPRFLSSAFKSTAALHGVSAQCCVELIRGRRTFALLPSQSSQNIQNVHPKQTLPAPRQLDTGALDQKTNLSLLVSRLRFIKLACKTQYPDALSLDRPFANSYNAKQDRVSNFYLFMYVEYLPYFQGSAAVPVHRMFTGLIKCITAPDSLNHCQRRGPFQYQTKAYKD